MKLVGLVIISITVFWAALSGVWALSLHPSEWWFWLCAAISLGVLFFGLTVGFRRTKPRLALIVTTVVLSTAVVFAADFIVAVALSCMHGDCI